MLRKRVAGVRSESMGVVTPINTIVGRSDSHESRLKICRSLCKGSPVIYMA